MHSKRIFSLILALVILASVAVSVSADWLDNANISPGERVIVCMDGYCNPGASGVEDTMASPSYNYTFHTGHTANVHMGYMTADYYSLGSPRHSTDGNTIWAYCMEFDVEAYAAADRFGSTYDSNADRAWSRMSAGQRRGVMLTTLYGYPVNTFGVAAADAYAATQVIIWEFQTGVRNSTTSNIRQGVNYSFNYASVNETVYLPEDYFYNIIAISPNGIAAYNSLIAKIYSHDTQPSFAGSRIELDYDRNTGKFTKTLTDTNGVISTYDVTADSGVSCSVSGNTLTLTSSKYVDGANLNLTKKAQPATAQDFLLMSPTPEGQSMVIGQRQVDVAYSYKIYSIAKGDLAVLKLDSGTEKPIPGAEFELYDKSDNFISKVTTNDKGEATVKDIVYGDYYVVESSAPTGYKLSDKKFSFSITEQGQVVKETFKDENIMHKIAVYKQGETLTKFDKSTVDGKDIYTPVYEVQYLSGCEVQVFAVGDIVTADGTVRYQDGELVDTVVTDSLGPVYTKELFEGKYLVKEKNAPKGYVIGNNSEEINLFDDDQEVTFENDRQKCALTFKKSMSNTTKDAMSAYYKKVSFGVFTGEEICGIPAGSLLEIIKPDSTGDCIMTVDLPCGYKYYVKELGTAEGFVLDEKKYEFALRPMPQTMETFLVSINENNEVVNEMVPVEIQREVLSESGEVPDTYDVHSDEARLFLILAVESLILVVILVIRKKKLTLYN